MSNIQNMILGYMKNPFICAGLIALITYVVYSNNYMTKKNVKERFPLVRQRTMNLKAALYVFLASVVVLFLFRYASTELEEEVTTMLGGSPPF